MKQKTSNKKIIKRAVTHRGSSSRALLLHFRRRLCKNFVLWARFVPPLSAECAERELWTRDAAEAKKKHIAQKRVHGWVLWLSVWVQLPTRHKQPIRIRKKSNEKWRRQNTHEASPWIRSSALFTLWYRRDFFSFIFHHMQRDILELFHRRFYRRDFENAAIESAKHMERWLFGAHKDYRRPEDEKFTSERRCRSTILFWS